LFVVGFYIVPSDFFVKYKVNFKITMGEREAIPILFGLVFVLLKKRQLLLQLNNSPDRRRGLPKPKKWGVRPILLMRKRFGCYENLLQEARLSDPIIFFNFTRMSASSFDKLLGIIGPHIRRRSNREPISPGCR